MCESDLCANIQSIRLSFIADLLNVLCLVQLLLYSIETRMYVTSTMKIESSYCGILVLKKYWKNSHQ